jgi:hypothetical protein
LTPSITFAHDCIILDACCVINLYASGRIREILEAVPTSVSIATYVHEQEALFVGTSDGSGGKERIDLEPLIDQGLIRSVQPETEEENITFVDFAAELGDDGEAMTGAIAVHRNWAIGTDDRGAIRFFHRAAPQFQIISSLELIKDWTDVLELSADEICSVLRNVRICGRYQPHDAHVLAAWWQSFYKE